MHLDTGTSPQASKEEGARTVDANTNDYPQNGEQRMMSVVSNSVLSDMILNVDEYNECQTPEYDSEGSSSSLFRIDDGATTTSPTSPM